MLTEGQHPMILDRISHLERKVADCGNGSQRNRRFREAFSHSSLFIRHSLKAAATEPLPPRGFDKSAEGAIQCVVAA